MTDNPMTVEEAIETVRGSLKYAWSHGDADNTAALDFLQARIKELEVKAERYDWLSNNDPRATWQAERELAVAEARIKELEVAFNEELATNRQFSERESASQARIKELEGMLELIRERVLYADKELMGRVIPSGRLAVEMAIREAAAALAPSRETE